MLNLSDRAASELAKAAVVQEFSCLRIAAESAGCSGLRYSLNVELTKKPDDIEIDAQGVTLFLDPDSSSLLAAATLDFSAEEGGFILNNPNGEAGGNCSCGGGGGH